MSRLPKTNEYAPYYETYISKVPKDTDIIKILEEQKSKFLGMIRSLSDEQLNYAYDLGKWTVRQSIMHIIETERIFAFRALVISRNDKTSIPGFDQNVYVENNIVNHLDIDYLAKDFSATRNSSTIMFRGFADEQWLRIGTASDNPVSVRATAYMIAGHLNHHLALFKDRYGIAIAEQTFN